MILKGNCLDKLKKLEEDSVDLLCTDPPYGYSFMNKDWDKALVSVDIWKEVLRVLKPGAFGFIMSAPRQDVLSRMIVNLSDAGFKVDFTSMYWTFANGFPKANNIGKAIDKKFGIKPIGEKDHSRFSNIDGWNNINKWYERPPATTDEAKKFEGSYGGFQPKPAVEVIIVVQKPPTESTQVGQALDNGKGITWLDDCRIPYTDTEPYTPHPRGSVESVSCPETFLGYGKDALIGSSQGRFPANLLVSDDVLDKHSKFFSLDAWAERNLPFIICPKASKREKNAGLKRKNIHPTVKPIKLMSYLITMGSREGDIVLDPFAGSGSTGVAVVNLNRKYIMIEMDADYYEILKARIHYAEEQLGFLKN